MRLAAIAFACLLPLAGCQTSGGITGADITNDINLACNSAQQLLGLAGLPGSTAAMAMSAAKLASKVNIYCTGAQLAAPVVTVALAQVNTAAAKLLGTGVAKR